MIVLNGSGGKVVDPASVAAAVFDGATLAIHGCATLLVPDTLLKAVQDRFLSDNAPRRLTALLPVTASLGPGTGLDRLAEDGLLERMICGSLPIYPKSRITDKIATGELAAWNIPMGICYALLRETAARRPGVLTQVGLGTFIDPAQGGGRLNTATQHDIVQAIKFNDESFLFFPSIPIDVALLRASTADVCGNLTFEREPITSGAVYLAMAAKANGGRVFAEVDRLANRHALPARNVVVPGNLVDGIVVSPGHEPPEADPLGDTSGEMRTAYRLLPLPEGADYLILARAAGELRKGWCVNLGVGLGVDLPRIFRVAGLDGALTFTTEHGAFNGIPNRQPTFGSHVNPDAILDPTIVFDMYAGGMLDATVLGFAEVDRHGNINAHQVGDRIVGCGGFLDITARTRNILFCGLFTAGGAEVEVCDGRVTIRKEGRIRKLVESVRAITLNGQKALQSGKRISLITERGLLRLTDRGWVLTEVAPGVDPERDIAPMVEFPLAVAPDAQRYPREVFPGESNILGEWLSHRVMKPA